MQYIEFSELSEKSKENLARKLRDTFPSIKKLDPSKRKLITIEDDQGGVLSVKISYSELLKISNPSSLFNVDLYLQSPRKSTFSVEKIGDKRIVIRENLITQKKKKKGLCFGKVDIFDYSPQIYNNERVGEYNEVVRRKTSKPIQCFEENIQIEEHSQNHPQNKEAESRFSEGSFRGSPASMRQDMDEQEIDSLEEYHSKVLIRGKINKNDITQKVSLFITVRLLLDSAKMHLQSSTILS